MACMDGTCVGLGPLCSKHCRYSAAILSYLILNKIPGINTEAYDQSHGPHYTKEFLEVSSQCSCLNNLFKKNSKSLKGSLRIKFPIKSKQNFIS